MKHNSPKIQSTQQDNRICIDGIFPLNERKYSINDVFEMLLPIFTPLIKRYLQLFFAKGEDSEDLYQQGLIGLFNAIKSYDFTKNGNFYLHAKRCIRLSILNLVRANNAKKRLINYNALSYDAIIPINLEKNYYQNFYSNHSQKILNPEENFIAQETSDEIHQKIHICLSELEYSILEMYLHGYSYKEISIALNKSKKTVDNALFRIKNKLKKLR